VRGADGRKEPGRLSRKSIYDGRIVHLSLDTVRFPDGETGELELITHPGASAIVPFLDPPDSTDPRIVLIRQYRYAAGGEIFEVPAGIPLSSAEGWQECARRELTEETGYEARELHYLTRIYTTPGFTDEVIHLFAATHLSPGRMNRDADEFIEVVPLPLSQVLAKVRAGEIVDAKSLCAILFAATFHGVGWPEGRLPPSR
jgi:ADP-ribose pyrophosphatase